jgi:RHS repeat-associated protein
MRSRSARRGDSKTLPGRASAKLFGAVWTAVADGVAAVQARYIYDAYGARVPVTEATSTTWGFTGRRTDPSGLGYYRSRYVDPTAGRWSAVDAMGFADGPNTYQSILSQPTNSGDPQGYSPLAFLDNPNCPQGRTGLEPRIVLAGHQAEPTGENHLRSGLDERCFRRTGSNGSVHSRTEADQYPAVLRETCG